MSVASRIEKHFHTKRGFDFWIVVLAERVESETFYKLKGECQVDGGWYSRQWGPTPGGFAFRTEEAAKAFAEKISGGEEKPKKVKKSKKVASA